MTPLAIQSNLVFQLRFPHFPKTSHGIGWGWRDG
jgi:hypothetical protein